MKTRNYYSFFRFISGNYELIVVLLNGLLSEPLVACIMNGLHHSHSPQYREVLRLFFINWMECQSKCERATLRKDNHH